MKTVPIVYFMQSQPTVQYMLMHTSDDFRMLNIVQAFPFKLDTYHIRFKTVCEEVDPKITAWIDISNPNAKVPFIGDTIYAKLLHIKDANNSKMTKKLIEVNSRQSAPQQQQTRLQSSPQLHVNQQIQEQPQQQQKQQQPKSQLDYYNIQQQGLDNLLVSNSCTTQGISKSSNILDEFNDVKESPTFQFQAKSQPTSQHNLDKGSSTNGSVAKNLNLLGEYDDELVQQEISQQVQQQQVQPAVSNDIRLSSQGESIADNLWDDQSKSKDQQYIDKRVQGKVDDLNKIWDDESQYNALRQQAKDELDPLIQKWGFKDGVRNDIRLLISTLNQVLWDGADWTCSMSDVLTDGKLKAKYWAAIRLTHPDKNRNGHFKQKYTSERVFYELNQAWNKCKS